MNILEYLWCGNIEAAAYNTSSCAEYKKALQLINKNEEKLMASMTDAQKELFAGYTDSVREFRAIAECLLFQNSFRLGARMIVGKNESNLSNKRSHGRFLLYIRKMKVAFCGMSAG